jgi:hypothetical protein
VVLITSSVSNSHRAQRELRAILEKKGIVVVDELTCTGAFLFIKFGRPNKMDIQTITEAAKDLSRRVFAST